MLTPETRIFVAGHRGMVGSAVCRALAARGCRNLITRTRRELDLMDPSAVDAFFAAEKPEVVIHCAARVGGIHANRTYPVEFMRENIGVSFSVIDAAHKHGTQRLLYLGSSCIYPREAPQPLREASLLTSPLEPTNEAYALAKITALKYCQYLRNQYGVLFHSAMPTNLYGPGDNYHPENSHVIPGLLRRFHEAKTAGAETVILWGTGTVRREFLHVDDLAAGILALIGAENPPDIVNIGSGKDLTIRALADIVADVVGFKGEILQNPEMPDGTPRKCLDISRIRSLGWTPTISLEEGLRQTYADFVNISPTSATPATVQTGPGQSRARG
ncbi:MAG: GDP-L-fucose synthase [Verrucomicrobia bacterium]|nr:GDP-L-fucose synthase [Verrucomicrobiota bacterium]MCH8525869.1 GDP-L-fucose synthase [Kiritimatiellia bacterium]